MNNSRREALLKEYGEVSNNFRTLTDIRFRMLNFLPIATGALAATTAIKDEITPMGSLTLALFGLIVTVGLITYNARNDQLYDELVGRAASLERSLGVPDGAFANRPRAWLSIRIGPILWKVNHRTGIKTIYAASVALWLMLLFSALLELSRLTYLYFNLPHFHVPDPSAWVNGMALILAIGVTYLGSKYIKVQVEERHNEMRDFANIAYKKAISFDIGDVETALKDREFIKLCSNLAGDKDGNDTLARAKFLAHIEADSLGHYMLLGSKEQSASHLVALLTDLPPRWVFDCGEDRRGKAPDKDHSKV